MDHRTKPGSPGDILAHHGVKGMKWGIRKDDDPTAREHAKARTTASVNDTTKQYMVAAAKQESKPSEANLIQYQQKSLNKIMPEGAAPGTKPPTLKVKKQSSGLTPAQKKLLIGAGVGVGAVAGLYLVSKYTSHVGNSFDPANLKPSPDGSSVLTILKSPKPPHAWMKDMAGKPISADAFNGMVAHSQGKTWTTNNPFTPGAFVRPEFEIPAGTLYHRLSTRAEEEFTKPTYALSNVADWNRYATNFRGEKWGADEFYHVTWRSTAPVKVPDLTTVLETVRTSLSEHPGHGKISHEEAIKHYKDMTGGGWESHRSQIVVAALKKKGFGAVIDEMDAGVIGERPLVFFSDAVKPKMSSKMKDADFELAESKLIELTNRKL